MKLSRNIVISLVLFLTILSGTLYGYMVYKERKVAGIQTNEQPKLLTGLVVPHHKLAHRLIDEAYQKTSQKRYSRVVILSPNHYYPDAPSVMTAREIPGTEVDTVAVDTLSESFPDMQRSEEMIRGEHGIMLQTEYIRHYFPDASVIPLVVSRVLTREKAGELGRILATTLPVDTLYIASVDFSHNTTIEEGLNKNQETIVVLTRFDTQQLYTFGDDHLDAPFATTVWLLVLDALGARNFEVWESSHAGLITGDGGNQGTSYVTGAFYR